MTRFEQHQILGQALLKRFPELNPALGWQIIDWFILTVLDENNKEEE